MADITAQRVYFNGSDITPLQWKEALDRLAEAQHFIMVGGKVTAEDIRGIQDLQFRWDNGERSQYLFDEMMSL